MARLLLAAFSLALMLLLLEVGAALVLTSRDGELRWPGDRLDAQRNAYVEQTTEAGCAYGDSTILHPYLAFGQSGRGPCGPSYANSRSLIGHEFPDMREPRVAHVLVTGGSVAAQFAGDGRGLPPEGQVGGMSQSALERILNSEFLGDRWDRIVVLNGGHGAWKQPNQYVLFGLYAEVLDGVITLDGFNEHYMLQSRSKRFELPANNFFGVVGRFDDRSTSGGRADFLRRWEGDLRRGMEQHAIFGISNFAFLLGDVACRRLLARADALGTGEAGSDWVRRAYVEMFDLRAELEADEASLWQAEQ